MVAGPQFDELGMRSLGPLNWKALGVIIMVLAQLLGTAFMYGTLVSRVNSVDEQVREIRQLILQRGMEK